MCINCARCSKVDKDGYITCPEFQQVEDAQACGMNVFLDCTCSNYRSKEGQGTEWAYCKAAYILDVAEVILPMIALVRAASIWEREQLIQAVFSGEPKTWAKATKKGIKGLFKALYLDGIDANTLRKVWVEQYA